MLANAQITERAGLGPELCLPPNQKVLDISFGWGGHANALWEMQPDISVTGITFSETLHTYTTQKAQQDQRQQDLALSSMRLPASARQFRPDCFGKYA